MTTSEYLIEERDNFLISKGIDSLTKLSESEISNLAEEFKALPQIQGLFTGLDILNSEYSGFSFHNVMSQLSGGVSTLFNPNVDIKDKIKNLATGGVYGTLSGNKVVKPPIPGAEQYQQIEDLQKNDTPNGKTNTGGSLIISTDEPKKIFGLSIPVFAGISAALVIIIVLVIWKISKK